MKQVRGYPDPTDITPPPNPDFRGYLGLVRSRTKKRISIGLSSVGLLFALLSVSCNNTNEDSTGRAPAGAVGIAGIYEGWLKIKNDSGSVSADDPKSVTITKTSDDKINIVIFKDDGYWDDLVLTAAMTSDSAFTVDKATWEGFAFEATGSLNGSELSITFTNGGEGSFVGTK